MRQRASCRNEEGFVLLAVLILTGLIGAAVLALSLTMRDGYREMKLQRDLSLARLHTDNAITRAIAALGNPEDPLHSALVRPNAPFMFRFNAVDVEILVENESGKIDLNRGDLAFIRNALNLIAPDEADTMLQRVIRMRESETFIPSIQTMLSVAQQYRPISGELARLFTVMTGATGIAPHWASPNVLAALPGLSPREQQLLRNGTGGTSNEISQLLAKHQVRFAPARAIFTIRARLSSQVLPPVRRYALVSYLNLPIRRTSDMRMIAWAQE